MGISITKQVISRIPQKRVKVVFNNDESNAKKLVEEIKPFEEKFKETKEESIANEVKEDKPIEKEEFKSFGKKFEKESKPKKENNVINEKVMTTSEKIEMAQKVLGNTPAQVKRVKKDKGLIERTESSKTILTEDNKELLND